MLSLEKICQLILNVVVHINYTLQNKLLVSIWNAKHWAKYNGLRCRGYPLSYVVVTAMSYVAVESALVLLMLLGHVGGTTVSSINARATYSLFLLNPCVIMNFAGFVGVTLEDAHLSKVNWFFFVLRPTTSSLKGCMIFRSRCSKVIYAKSFFLA